MGLFDWLPSTHEAFTTTLRAGDSPYPCHFGVRGQAQGDNSFAALDERDASGSGDVELANRLLEFRERAWSGPKRQSLVVFVGPPRPENGLREDTARFWRLLTALSVHDPAPWPQDTPADPRDPAWQWCFGGEAWFVFMGSPAYRARRSRNLGPCLTLVFQTRRVFEGLDGTTHAGRAAKARVRQRLAMYDTVAPHPHLGDGTSSTTYKWRQYALPDDQAGFAVGACPWPGPR